MTAFDILVVGAGPAGSAIAARMARAGASVLLVEAAAHPRPKACAEYASPRTADELARLGVDSAWTDEAVRLRGMDLHVADRCVPIRYADRGGPRNAWGVDRRTFDHLLAHYAAASGAELREHSRVDRLLRDHRGRVRGARVRDTPSGRTESVTATWTVGADGSRSTASRLLGVDRRVRFPRRLGLVAHYAGVPELTDHGEMHVGEKWYVGLAPTPGGELNVGMALPLDGSGGGAFERFETAIAALPAVARRLAESHRISSIRGTAPIGHRTADVAGPGWLLVGDAAGFVDPFTGEGIHRALRSARAAEVALRGSGDVPAAYRRERHRAFAAKSVLSWLVQGALASPAVMDHAMERLATRPRAALRLGSALGDCRPATDALSPIALLEALGP